MLIFSVLTLGLLIAVQYMLDRQRNFEPDLSRMVETSQAPGRDMARAGVRALEVGDAAAASRLFERALEAAPSNARWEFLLSRAKLELEAQRRSATFSGAPPPRRPAPEDASEELTANETPDAVGGVLPLPESSPTTPDVATTPPVAD